MSVPRADTASNDDRQLPAKPRDPAENTRVQAEGRAGRARVARHEQLARDGPADPPGSSGPEQNPYGGGEARGAGAAGPAHAR
eukprot:722352-Prymnesium_polylepis.1